MAFIKPHFYHRFDATKTFAANKDFLFAGNAYKVGDIFDKTNIPAHKIKRLFDARKLRFVEAEEPKVEEPKAEEPKAEAEALTVEAEALTVDKAVVVETGTKAKWYHVEIDGEKIGKSTRDEEEAQGWADDLNG